MAMNLTEKKKTLGGRKLGEVGRTQKFSFGHIKLDMAIRNVNPRLDI